METSELVKTVRVMLQSIDDIITTMYPDGDSKHELKLRLGLIRRHLIVMDRYLKEYVVGEEGEENENP